MMPFLNTLLMQTRRLSIAEQHTSEGETLALCTCLRSLHCRGENFEPAFAPRLNTANVILVQPAEMFNFAQNLAFDRRCSSGCPLCAVHQSRVVLFEDGAALHPTNQVDVSKPSTGH